MGKTVEELGAMSSAELCEWMAYDRIDPFGQERGDLGHAITASTVASVMTKKSYRAVEFMPSFEPKRAMPLEQMKANFRKFKERIERGRVNGEHSETKRCIDR